MNIYAVLAMIAGSIVLYFSLELSAQNSGGIKVFFDLISIFIVVGGSIVSSAIALQFDRVLRLVKVFFSRVLRFKRADYAVTIKELMQVCEDYRTGTSLEKILPNVKDAFLRESLQLIVDEVAEADRLLEILDERAQNLNSMYVKDANRFMSLAKYPPAFGMMGTTIGMIVLLGSLGEKDAMKTMGPAMGICLITTLYGAVISNMVILPVGENLLDSSEEVFVKNKIIIRGVELILEKTNPILLAEILNSYLLPSSRLDWKSVRAGR
ncbi:MAG: hypothetical protein A2504_10075 [Bdellovibrionales bacterium RIFOXYD12_FULL_39_22]|nr:MAG: hypothetical protein A2385_17710 [Bdellovibrionales bacterium RIFOXYB1_FULL_39_21]OFZ43956.1 MAG: hypothetical protein A2485_04380 [Bdellovibrionales bacterium RIFOXYC12_FULL_39_17]OFZ48328.1 MAG: hypothetical protein A2404_01795 [Bdellovibrionales bacterium RIFOXYC1_FULL_39_130]OFZ76633.1 MAG: hypothetical protein A2560_17390 [Bdellovibrionales bacterium RIFOXYD1_FULL_39_84]OFZ94919.1 MAG: hypothetical protein A2504_10075 [Bdellovibrionales bacterium RIFOXYD12_FULL_39_22]HLE12659.1 Mo